MLASRSRLRASEDFRATVRQGVRAARPSVVVHMRPQPSPLEVPTDDPSTRVGFVVSKSVGGAVQRNRVKRRLRHAARPLVRADPGLMVVVRALPGAASSRTLVDDLTDAWQGARRRLAGRAAVQSPIRDVPSRDVPSPGVPR